MATLTCPQCGDEVPGTVTFCKSCGERIDKTAVSVSSDTNPYSSPAPMQIEIKSEGPASYQLASSGQRLANLVIDKIATFVLSNLMGFVLGFLVALYFAANGREMNEEQLNGLELAATLLGIVIIIFYFAIAESLGHRTIGKLITGTKVVREDGGPPTFGQVLGRTAARFIPFEAFSFLGKEPVGWHDSLSGTRVIKTR